MYGVLKGTQQGHIPEKRREDPPLPQQCSICSQTNHISTSTQHCARSRGPKAFDTNSRVALAALDNSIDYSHPLTRKTYKARERKVGKIAEGVAKTTYKVMFDKECKMAALWILMVSYPCLYHMTWDSPKEVGRTEFPDRSWYGNGLINWESTRRYY
ncbi:hypothetical protein P5673_023113 [Acropora cervicornis]|uniref:Mutator-like transposase domain-containing protein n=1 Tax=Acropora cervicornis TaxID=6130 RepID=A0AAD9Q5K0_ACRCE|nr:hypothetical protein P5673_023113 [Acropora cervicornis]